MTIPNKIIGTFLGQCRTIILSAISNRSKITCEKSSSLTGIEEKSSDLIGTEKKSSGLIGIDDFYNLKLLKNLLV